MIARSRSEKRMTALELRSLAIALGGETSNGQVLCPGPGHSSADRSLAVLFDDNAPDGFVVFSFAGDTPAECRDYVRAAIGLSPRERRRWRASGRWSSHHTVAPDNNAADRSALALRLWNEARDPHGTTVAGYLASRDLTLPDDIAGDVIRFHPALKFEGGLLGAMEALFRDIGTDEPCGIHRTFLDGAGRKLDRKMLGRARGAAIKLDADETVTLGLHIGEGVETCLAAWLAGFRPVWALGSATAIAAFPVLSGIEAITVLGEVGDGGANHRAAQACASSWIESGRDAFMVVPQVGGDLNDVWREMAT
jgi:putative DNA primase/helicase